MSGDRTSQPQKWPLLFFFLFGRATYSKGNRGNRYLFPGALSLSPGTRVIEASLYKGRKEREKEGNDAARTPVNCRNKAAGNAPGPAGNGRKWGIHLVFLSWTADSSSFSSSAKLDFISITLLLLLCRDPRTNGRAHIQPAEDVYSRIRNFDALVRAVKGFYEVSPTILFCFYVEF